jgi:hypothetical protein
VTNLGISVKDSPQRSLIFVTALDTGEPVRDARVSIVKLDNEVFWRGTTNANGLAIAPDTALRDTERYFRNDFDFIRGRREGARKPHGSGRRGGGPWRLAAGIGVDRDGRPR